MGRKASPNKNDFSTQLEKQEKNIALLKKEIQIEASLEKVRARTMAMQKSEELGDVVKVLYQEFKVLGMADWGCAIMIFDKEANQIEYWVSEATNSDLSCFYVKGQENSVYQKLWKHWEKQGESLNLHHTDEFKKEFDTYWLNETDFKRLPEVVKERVYADREIFLTFSTMQYGMLNATGKTKLSEGQIKVLERFAKVFEQTYTRFLDLQKAEEQAREARIETALEKIRSNMMAMHQSDQLRQVVATMFEQLQNLGFDSSASMINIYNDDLSSEQWLAGFSYGELPKSYHIPYCDHPYFTEEVSGWQDGLPFHELIFEGPQKVEYGKWMIENSDYKFLPAEFHQEMLSPERIYISNAHMKYGLVGVWGAESLPEKSINVLIRFAKVFEQTYTRFLDLQKAEAQAREAEIQLALERVRARTMAMHRSEELGEVAILLYKEFNALKMGDFFNCGFVIVNEADSVQNGWMTQPEGTFIEELDLPYPGDDILQKRMKAWKKKVPVFCQMVSGEKLKKHFKYVNERSKSTNQINTITPFMPDPCYFYCGNFKEGYLHIVAKEELVPEAEAILSRFTKVFSQTYTRFLDLQKAEKQAKEAQIETALEKVRSRTMAMQKSEELLDLVKKIYSEIEPFGVSTTGITIALFIEEENAIENWFADNLHSDLLQSYKVVGQKNKVFKQIWEDWKNKNPQRKMYLEGPDKRGYDNYILTETDYRQLPEELKEEIHSHKSVCFTFTYFKYGYFESVDLTIPAEENSKILLRFAKVFEQTYTRFLDLQKAETQAKEAIRQASLDRVRGEIASMRSTEDLNRITPLIWNELTALGVSFIRCGVFIIDEKSEMVDIYLSSPDGKSLGVMKLPFNSNDLTANTVKAWKKDCVYHQFWSRDAFISWTNSLLSQGFISDKEKYQGNQEAPAALNLNFIPFTQGMLYVGTAEELPNSEVELVKSLAKAFALAYSRYEDFVKLEMAKSEIESTLSDLKATQAQLIQQEKLASLGQLTAGIAHEIKNPLNFVTNFSDVSIEMIDEALEELGKSTQDDHTVETTAIMSDIRSNLFKIHEHGSRADGIVKSMLQHSRGGDGKMEPSPLNPIIKEYVNLAFHGMRASKEPINVDIDLQLDESIGNVALVAEDFSRVILNLCNNAFDAMRDKETQNSESKIQNYTPKLMVRTGSDDGKVIIEVHDNGPGIPDEIIDKILQPFFTTKKGTQGTGLGLSITNDIVKAHGGSLDIHSQPGQTVFTIKLIG